MNTLIPRGGNDCVYTPDQLAFDIVRHFYPQISGRILEPCSGKGAFLRAFRRVGLKLVISLEIKKDRDFFKFITPVNWIITNPPWSQAREFLRHSYNISNNIVFLITTNHIVGLRGRRQTMKEYNFGIKEVVEVETPPKPWPQSGFQLAAIHLQRDWKGSVIFSELNKGIRW